MPRQQMSILKAQQSKTDQDISIKKIAAKMHIFSIKNKDYAKPDLDSVRQYLLTLPDVVDGTSLKNDKLISDYAFRKLLRQNFNNLVLGNDNSSKIARYATLDISNKQKFDFSPLTFEHNPLKRNYQSIFSVNFSGELNAKGEFESFSI